MDADEKVFYFGPPSECNTQKYDHVATIFLNNPKAYNALDSEMLKKIGYIFRDKIIYSSDR